MNFDTPHCNIESKILLDLNKFIHGENDMFNYHMNHILLVRKYALLLNRRMRYNLNPKKLSYISLAHDLFKERSLNPSKTEDVIWNTHIIPQDTNKYVRNNLDILAKYKLDDYFNSDMQYHALSSGIFVERDFGITDLEILYGIYFHSCQIIEVYEKLPLRTQQYVDVIMLADKLSSNWLRINMRKVPVRTDLDLAVFGANGRELNFSLGLYLARMISQGKSKEKQSQIATKYYYNRLCKINPVVAKNFSFKKLGGPKLWPVRRSQAFRMD